MIFLRHEVHETFVRLQAEYGRRARELGILATFGGLVGTRMTERGNYKGIYLQVIIDVLHVVLELGDNDV
jgi:hypothetical protein